MSFKTCSYFHIIFINLFKKINYNNKYLLIFNKIKLFFINDVSNFYPKFTKKCEFFSNNLLINLILI